MVSPDLMTIPGHSATLTAEVIIAENGWCSHMTRFPPPVIWRRWRRKPPRATTVRPARAKSRRATRPGQPPTCKGARAASHLVSPKSRTIITRRHFGLPPDRLTPRQTTEAQRRIQHNADIAHLDMRETNALHLDDDPRRYFIGSTPASNKAGPINQLEAMGQVPDPRQLTQRTGEIFASSNQGPLPELAPPWGSENAGR